MILVSYNYDLNTRSGSPTRANFHFSPRVANATSSGCKMTMWRCRSGQSREKPSKFIIVPGSGTIWLKISASLIIIKQVNSALDADKNVVYMFSGERVHFNADFVQHDFENRSVRVRSHSISTPALKPWPVSSSIGPRLETSIVFSPPCSS